MDRDTGIAVTLSTDYADRENTMKLSRYDEKHVQVKTVFGDTFTGVADFFDSSYVLHEYGKDEDSLIIGGYLILKSQIDTIEEIEVHGTVELRTERLILRRLCRADSEDLYRYIGKDRLMHQYSGWNPYATLEMSRETVRKHIESYKDEHFYSWVIDSEDVLFGTIGAYDYKDGHIEVGYSIVRDVWGRGYATEALKRVLEYLTVNEGIPCVTAWCASENIGSRRVLDKAGMKLVSVDKDGLRVGDRVYDKLNYEFRKSL